MSRLKDHKVRKCGCVIYKDDREPTLCEKHLKKAHKRAEKQRRDEERGLRKAAIDAAAQRGHDLGRFVEYGASGQPGKWTAFCAHCGDIVIVYDQIDQAPGDQVLGRPLTEPCRRSPINAAMKETTDGGPREIHGGA